LAPSTAFQFSLFLNSYQDIRAPLMEMMRGSELSTGRGGEAAGIAEHLNMHKNQKLI
jgi:hypothetical protein